MKEIIWSLIALGLVALVLATTAVFFLPAIIEVLINGAIIYFIFLKASADIRKRNRLKMYLFAGLVSALFLALVGNILPFLWMVTTWTALTMFIVALIVIMLSNKK